MNVSTVGYRISSVKLHLFCSKWVSLENNNKSVAGYIMNEEINLYANFICCNYSIPFVDVDLHIFFNAYARYAMQTLCNRIVPQFCMLRAISFMKLAFSRDLTTIESFSYKILNGFISLFLHCHLLLMGFYRKLSVKP